MPLAYDRDMGRVAAWAALLLLASSEALAQTTAPNPKPPASEYVHITVIYWAIGALSAVGAFIGTVIKMLWSRISELDKQHQDQLKQLIDAHAKDQRETYTKHAQEIAVLRDRLDREQSERRQDTERLHSENKEVMRTCMTTFQDVTRALDKNTEQVARLRNEWIGEEG